MGRRSAEEYLAAAIEVVRAMLADHGALTASEMEARASDRTYDTNVAPFPINPHHLVDARQLLRDAGEVEYQVTASRGKGRPVITWTHSGPTKAALRVAGRKRLLTNRHGGWGQRGGNGRGLMGAAGENAMVTAMRAAPGYASIDPSTTTVLGVDLTDLGEVDIASGLYDASDPNDPRAITIMIEVKNTRSWYYNDTVHNDDGKLRRFLRKAARVQDARPSALICPVVVVRRAHQTLIDVGNEMGFVVASTVSQLVLEDHDIAAEPGHFDQVRDELGYADLRLVRSPTATSNYHKGIATKHIPKNARAAAELWVANFHDFVDDADGVPF